jgi:hypothetical protein
MGFARPHDWLVALIGRVASSPRGESKGWQYLRLAQERVSEGMLDHPTVLALIFFG